MNHGRVKASHCRKSQDGRRTPYSSITITARSLGSCLLCRHVGTCVFAKGTFNLKTERLWLFLPPYTSDCLSVESFHICFFLFSYFIRRCWEFTHSSVSLLYLTNSKMQPYSGFARTWRTPIRAGMLCIEIVHEARSVWEFRAGCNLTSVLVATMFFFCFVLVFFPPHIISSLIEDVCTSIISDQGSEGNQEFQRSEHWTCKTRMRTHTHW